MRNIPMKATTLFCLAALAGVLTMNNAAVADAQKDAADAAKKAETIKAKTDAGMKRAQSFADDWEKQIKPYLDQMKKNPACGDVCKKQVKLETSFAVRHLETIDCDARDAAGTLAKGVQQLFETRAGKYKDTLLVHPAVSCPGERLSVKMEAIY
jgi:hypothetical protein